MFIAHVTFQTAPADRDTALAALMAEAPTVRAMPGCRKFQPFLDPSGETGLGVVHEWDDPASFAAYLASPGFAEAGRITRPLMTAPPVSRRFEARLVETVA